MDGKSQSARQGAPTVAPTLGRPDANGAVPVLAIERLTVGYRAGDGWRDAVRDVSLHVGPGETVGLVGESGSGKSTMALAALRALGEGGAVRGGAVRLRGTHMAALRPRGLPAARGDDPRRAPPDPLAALNPAMRVGDQVAEALAPGAGRAQARAQALALLRRVGLADPERVARSYPHELSGGMQQRVLIAMAVHGDPALLILDEPTSSLDVTTEAAILDLLEELVRPDGAEAAGRAALFISHNLGVVARLCDRVAVLYAGELVEEAPTGTLFAAPLHPYTVGLIASLPRPGARHDERPLRPIPGAIPSLAALPSGCVFAPRCPLAVELCHAQRPPDEQVAPGHRVRCHRWRDVAAGALAVDGPPRDQAAPARLPLSAAERGAGGEVSGNGISSFEQPLLQLDGVERHIPTARGTVRAVDGVDLTVGRGRTLGVVGESGSGKTTLARCVVGLAERTDGAISLLDLPLAPRLEARAPALLRRLQMVFQNPQEALNPYLTVGEALRRPLMRLGGLGRAEAAERAARLLEAVKLDPGYAARLPAQLSGGERQRVAIARAFAADPDLVLLDEAVSALDVSVQAAVLNLLSELRRTNGASYLFITHDLGVVRYLADDVAVLYLGQVQEQGPVGAVLAAPSHPYTEALISAVPELPRAAGGDGAQGQHAGRVRLAGEPPSPLAIPTGCRFHTRCPRFLGELCRTTEPPWRDAGGGHRIRCHIPLDELAAAQAPRREEETV